MGRGWGGGGGGSGEGKEAGFRVFDNLPFLLRFVSAANPYATSKSIEKHNNRPLLHRLPVGSIHGSRWVVTLLFSVSDSLFN